MTAIRVGALTAIAQMTRATFMSHMHNGDVPFYLADFREEDRRRWRNFSLHHATLLIAARGHACMVGWSKAAGLLRSWDKQYQSAPVDGPEPYINDLFLVVGAFHMFQPKDGSSGKVSVDFILSGFGARPIERALSGFPGSQTDMASPGRVGHHALSVVNLSEAYVLARQRYEALTGAP